MKRCCRVAVPSKSLHSFTKPDELECEGMEQLARKDPTIPHPPSPSPTSPPFTPPYTTLSHPTLGGCLERKGMEQLAGAVLVEGDNVNII